MLSRGPVEVGKRQPKVSVLLLTYNHEKWISHAIESVLSQQTDFVYEVVIIEDCSTDRTREIVKGFERSHPERVKLILSEKNGEYRANFAKAYLTSAGQYVVPMDGDDYFSSLHKLQEQADFLDSHPECAICFHNVEVFYEDGSHEPWLRHPPDREKFTTLEDLLISCFIAGSAPMLRNRLFDELPDWYYSAPSGDWPLYILTAQHGKIGYIDEVMGAYRVHSEGMWSKLDDIQRLEQVITFYVDLNAILNREYDDVIKRAVCIHLRYYTDQYGRRLQKDSKKRENRLRGALNKERRRSRRLKVRNRNIRLKLQRLNAQLSTIRVSRTHQVVKSVNRIKSILLRK